MGLHINKDGKFQSDKYPTCPPGKVPLSVNDPMAQELLWIYALRRRAVDADFSADLEAALRAAGFTPEEPYAWDDWADDGTDWDAETGAPSKPHFAGVVQTYALMQQRDHVTVEEIATALNVQPRRVIEAVEWHYWMFLEGPDDQPLKQWIYHEGE